MECLECGNSNDDDRDFCSTCGWPLKQKDYIARKVREELSAITENRDLVEAQIAHSVFDKVVGWLKIHAIVISIAVAIVGGGGVWRFAEWGSQLDKSQKDAVKVSGDLKETAQKTKDEMLAEAAALRVDIDNSRKQLDEVSHLTPEVEAIRKQLDIAVDSINNQQKVISSSSDFIRSIFSSHATEYFQISKSVEDQYLIVPPSARDSRSVVFILLKSVPIDETVQLQFHVYSEPQNSYQTFHNMLIFYWGDPPQNLSQHQLSVSYFR